MGEHLDVFFFFNDTATTEIYTLSLHDALPIYLQRELFARVENLAEQREPSSRRRRCRPQHLASMVDRKSTRLNSSHANISYAVFCLKKKPHNDHQLFAFTQLHRCPVA